MTLASPPSSSEKLVGGLAGAAARAAAGARRRLLDLAQQRSAPLHLASALSALEMLAVAALADDGDGRLLLSKGHGALGYYAILASVGRISDGEFRTYGLPDSRLTIHPERGRAPSVDFSTGSLGHGPALAAGWIIGRRLQGTTGRRITVLIGDGEAQEGSIWEAAAFAVDAELHELRVLVDANGYGQNGVLFGTSSADGIATQFAALGWSVDVVDGHDTASIAAAFEAAGTVGRPSAVVGRTQKANGAPGLIRGLPSTHFSAWIDA